jgi:hypothetical protein
MGRLLKRTLIFGSVSGALWSFVAGALDNLFDSKGQTITVVVAGLLTGIAVSFILLFPLSRSGRGSRILLGLAALPLGAFVFGILASSIQLIVKTLGGVPYSFVEYGFNPITIGFNYAVYSVISVFALALFPLALFTTYCMHACIESALRLQNQQPTDPAP